MVKSSLMRLAYIATAAILATGPVLAATVPLRAPDPSTLLPHHCGGVHVATYATGFDADGHVTGIAHAWTRCPQGSARYRPTKLHAAWYSLVWDSTGAVLDIRSTAPAQPNPALTATNASGHRVATHQTGPDGVYTAVLTTP
jgi:hypothetical protein